MASPAGCRMRELPSSPQRLFNVDEIHRIPPEAHSRGAAATGQQELNKHNCREMRTSSVGALVPFISADGGVFMSFFVIKDKEAHQLSLVIPKESKHRRFL